MLDTDICIYLINRRSGYERILSQLDGREYGDVLLSSITLAELHYGIAASQQQSTNLDRLRLFLARFKTAYFDDAAAISYGQIRYHLRTRGTPIDPLDTLIAGHALALNATLVTNNQREFERVPNLSLANWFD